MQQHQSFAIWLLVFGIIGVYSKAIQQPALASDDGHKKSDIKKRATEQLKDLLDDPDYGKTNRAKRGLLGRIPYDVTRDTNQAIQRAIEEQMREQTRRELMRIQQNTPNVRRQNQLNAQERQRQRALERGRQAGSNTRNQPNNQWRQNRGRQ